jgi:hypothetical protein
MAHDMVIALLEVVKMEALSRTRAKTESAPSKWSAH